MNWALAAQAAMSMMEKKKKDEEKKKKRKAALGRWAGKPSQSSAAQNAIDHGEGLVPMGGGSSMVSKYTPTPEY